jgi:hypothetical protein
MVAVVFFVSAFPADLSELSVSIPAAYRQD